MPDPKMTRAEYNRFKDVLKNARHEIDTISVEVIISDEKDDDGGEVWEEICEFPAKMEQDEYDDWLDIDEDAMSPFPVLLQGYYDTCNAYAEFDAADRAQRRAESGYAQ